MSRARGDEGQSSVELALTLPFVLLLLLALVQAGLFVRDQVLVIHATREAVRVAAVSPDVGRVENAARQSTNLDPALLQVTRSARGEPGSTVTVRVDYESPVRVPLVGLAWKSTRLSATATIRIES
ncbi:MAG: pilus assembly protein [Actinobacteria bacterium]|nr:pilus assembly protein [Actinomycetota bacterium]